MKHPIPDKALRESGAIIGRRGSGKTYVAKGIVERKLAAGDRTCIIDPTGAWWGLRSSADGTKPGFPVLVFGGDHADVKLTDGMGSALAEQLGSQNMPAIVDVSEFTMAGRVRFVTAFLEALYRVNRLPLSLFIDEADMFAPQRPGKDELTMLGRMEQIARRGRVRGFIPWLITQRPASLHKSVLSQVNTLVAMQLTAPQDRDALGDWIEGQADRAEGKRILAELPKLPEGEGFVWVPHEGMLERVKFPPIATFDSSRSPEPGVAPPPVNLAKVDLTALSGALLDMAEPDEGDELAGKGRAVLEARIVELEEQLANKPPSTGPDPETLAAEYSRGLRRGVAEAWTAEWPSLQELRGTLAQAIVAIDAFGQKVADSAEAEEPPPIPESVQISARSYPRATQVTRDAAAGGLGVGERAILTAIAQHPRGVTREQLSILTGYRRSTRDTYVQRLAGRDMVLIQADGTIEVLLAGKRALGPDFQPLPTGAKLRAHWMGRLPEGERRIFEVVIGAYPKAVERDALSQATDYKRSTRDTYLQRLAARRLVTADRGAVRAAEELFR